MKPGFIFPWTQLKPKAFFQKTRLSQVEYIKTLYIIGQTEKAKQLFEKYISLNPNSDELIRLKEELSL